MMVVVMAASLLVEGLDEFQRDCTLINDSAVDLLRLR